MEQETKRCPYCGEEILAVAKKCKHCGEWFEPKEIAKEQKPCPVCGELIDTNSSICPYCQEKTHFNDAIASGTVGQEINKNNETINKLSISASHNDNHTKKEKETKKKKSSWIGDVWRLILLGSMILCFIGLKHCVREKPKAKFEVNSDLAKKLEKASKSKEERVYSYTEKREKAFVTITEAPWHSNYSNSASEIVDGWLVTQKISIATKLNYMSDEKYTEYGTFTIEISCSQADMMWKAEGKIQYHEEGIFSLYSNTSLSEQPNNILSEVIGADVKFNNTSIPDEDISMNVLKRLHDLNNKLKGTGFCRYKIKSLSNNSLVLSEMDENEVIKPTGVTLTYSRTY